MGPHPSETWKPFASQNCIVTPQLPGLCVTFCLLHLIAQGPNDFPSETGVVGRGEVLMRFCCELGKTRSGWKVEVCVLAFQGSPVPLTLLRVCGREGLTQQPHPPLCSCCNPADLLLRTLEELKMEHKLPPSKAGERFNLDG